MRPAVDLPEYSRPFYLYGNARPCAARSLAQLVADRLLTSVEAGRLVAIAGCEASLAIVASRAAAGKSSLLAALLPHLKGERDHYFLRGSYETFAFAGEASWRPSRAVLIANEISDFLPVYLPNHLAPEAFRLVGQGARLWGTAHADGMSGLLDRWSAWPRAAPLAVVTLGGSGYGIEIELSGGVLLPCAARRASRTIDSVCHAEGGEGMIDLKTRDPATASGLRPR